MEKPQKLKNFMLWEEIKPHIAKKLDLTDLLRNFVIAQFHLYQKPITKDDSKQITQCVKKYESMLKNNIKHLDIVKRNSNEDVINF